MHRFFEGRNKKPTKGTEEEALLQAWNAFVSNYSSAPHQWHARFEKARERHRQYSFAGKVVFLHSFVAQQGSLAVCLTTWTAHVVLEMPREWTLGPSISGKGLGPD